eukprot:CAMPEP_0194254618 /NCGR_PEP_ID=MMETSP0158-20130606/32623_1 /TAXON_ID=33649 /ORGANISM="Thalassionema nitzschioides, Strain L26-B" /LENGTH=63 /DNA_ID=CAMNT_0038992731 /DNA_START=30 /DNA_END=217 /DNA_ORIENTATION=+
MEWIESDGFTADIAVFKQIVPDAMGVKAWFESKGKWADGTKFGEPSVSSSAMSKAALIVVPLA